MKKFIFLIALFWGSLITTYGQDISIRVVQPERPNLTAESCRILQSLMTETLSTSGIVDNMPSNRFVLTAKADVMSKDIVAGTPARVSERLVVTFMIGDVVKNQVFSTCQIRVVGIGENEEQAIRKGINSIKPGNPNLQFFIEDAKAKIVNYYVVNEQTIYKYVDKLKDEGKYEEAIYELCLVPSACESVYERCQYKVLEVIQEMYNVQGAKFLTEAKAIWSGSLNRDGAERLLPVVKQISPYANCHLDAMTFLNEISEKLNADDQREWDFKVRQYEDELILKKRDLDAAIEKSKKAMRLREIEIMAARDVAIEQAKNQPEEVYESYVVPVLLW